MAGISLLMVSAPSDNQSWRFRAARRCRFRDSAAGLQVRVEVRARRLALALLPAQEHRATVRTFTLEAVEPGEEALVRLVLRKVGHAAA
jgi:hypothetical protein